MIRKYATYILGLYIVGLGVALILLSGLGSSPISSWAFVMSLHTPLSVGFYTFVLNASLIVGQGLVLHRHGLKSELVNIALQIPFSFVFGAFIDVNMHLLGHCLTPESLAGLVGADAASYPARLGCLLLGIAVQSVGIVFEVRPQVTMMSAEAFVFYVSRRWSRDFGRVKMRFDCSLVVLAVVFAAGFAIVRGESVVDAVLVVAREGTLLAAVLTGYFVRHLSRHVRPLDKFLRFHADL